MNKKQTTFTRGRDALSPSFWSARNWHLGPDQEI
jgi:hypothetical protein